MIQEIYQRGPIVCSIAVPETLEDYEWGVYEDKTGDTTQVHTVEVYGYAEEDGKKFWYVRNSWGRGVNNIGIESSCAWAVPYIIR